LIVLVFDLVFFFWVRSTSLFLPADSFLVPSLLFSFFLYPPPLLSIFLPIFYFLQWLTFRFVVTIQFTVVGQVGVDGPHAVNPAEPVLKNVLELVPAPLHVMAGTFALETRGENNCATRSHVLVGNELFLVHYFFFVNFVDI